MKVRRIPEKTLTKTWMTEARCDARQLLDAFLCGLSSSIGTVRSLLLLMLNDRVDKLSYQSA